MTRPVSPLQRLLLPAMVPLSQGAGLSVLAALIWLGQAWILATALADLLDGSGQPGQTALWFLGLSALRIGLNFLAEGRLFTAADRVVSLARERVLQREARAAGGSPGSIAALALESMDSLQPYVTRYYPAMARASILPPVILGLAFWHSWAVGLVLLVAGPLIPVFMVLIGWAAQEASRRQLTEIGAMGDMMVDRLAALADLRLIDAGRRVTEGFARAAEDLRARTMAVLRIAFLSSTVLELFAALGVAMVAVWTGLSLLGLIGWGTWGAPLSPVIGIFLLLLAPDFFQPLRDLASAWHDRAAARALAEELAEWEARPLTPILGFGAEAETLRERKVIRWERLAARGRGFPDARIAPGERVAVTGPSGAGKSTLLRLLAGLEAPEQGVITIGRLPLDDALADRWRAGLGWMPQHPHFPERPLSRIISEGPLDPDLLRLAALDQVLARLPEGAETVPGETGAGLSGGEARRVLLAKLLHARPEVVLVDEPTADLDPETAERVIEALLALTEGQTTLIVATHDPRLIARMDREVAL